MTIKVLMTPHGTELGDAVTGISRVVEAYFKHLPEFDIELVDKDATTYDIKAAHAGITDGDCDVCHCHGLHWTGNYPAPKWEYQVNAKVIDAIRNAKEVTAPSSWVAKAFQRDMRFTPHVIPHGIDWVDWQEPVGTADYVLYNKNRQGDVCDASSVLNLAHLVPSTKFMTTFLPRGKNAPPNVKVTGLVPFDTMKKMVQGANIYLAVTQETFGIGILEAMASGIPVLAYDYGGASFLVQHGVTGYLAQPGNIDDLVAGLMYCQEHRQVLGENGREVAKQWTWENACSMVADVYAEAMVVEPATVAVIIPCYNYSHLIGDAVKSACAQTYDELVDIIVVDDGSKDAEKTKQIVSKLAQDDNRICYLHQQNMGVAHARNFGIRYTDAKYIACLDADDQMYPTFLEKLIPPLERDPTLGITYAGLMLQYEKNVVPGDWPTEFDYDGQIQGHNQVPTCCVFRRKIWERLGGYRQRYADPKIGCGAEDAEFWLRIGGIGFGAKKITKESLFLYRLGGSTQKQGFKDTGKWLDWHPWTVDGVHPFASVATPALFSHQVRHYDDPLVSVIIPVGPGHEHCVIQALDSVEAQTVRRWELIVVWDTGGAMPKALQEAYPYVTWIRSEAMGTGAARNDGAHDAEAPFLLFLDADDYLLPNALEEMFDGYNETQAIIYSESLGIRAIDEADADQYRMRKELLKYEDGIAVIRQPVGDYIYDVAVKQPYTKKPYFWCYISSLVPKAWHDEIGGFDESLETWEDWDYWIRMAKAGKPFASIGKPLMVYNYDTGRRREYGCSIKHEVLELLKQKHEEVEVMACKGCGSNPINRRLQRTTPNVQVSNPTKLKDEDFVLCEYVRPKRGSHRVMGSTMFPNKLSDKMRRMKGGWVFDYGYHSQGETFLVHRRDMNMVVGWFAVAEKPKIDYAMPIASEPTVPEPPAPLVEKVAAKETLPEVTLVFDLQTIPGVTAILAKRLSAAGFTTPELILEAGVDGLKAVKGIGAARAESILVAVEELLTKPQPEEDAVIAELEKLLR